MRQDYSLPRLVLNALRAAVDLAGARIALRTIKPQRVLERNREVADLVARKAALLPPEETARRCDRVAFFINRMAPRVPWRSDCLVQALAGQRWLAREGIASEIGVGTAIGEGGAFEAHAWLRHGERILLGGDIARFSPLLHPDAEVFKRF